MINIVNFTKPFALLTRKWACSFAVFRFPLPDLGEKIKQGRVKKLYVKQGDRVTEFQKLADVQSDKQFTQISSPEEGVIKKLYYHEDQTCQVGDIFLDIQTQSAKTAENTSRKEEKVELPQMHPIQQPSVDVDEILTSPTVKMWARQHKVDLKEVTGTGRKGRILKGDIIDYIQARKNNQLKPKIFPEQKVEAVSQVTKVSMNELQKQRQKMALYSSTIPHLFLEQIFDVTKILQITESSRNRNQNISLLSILVKTFSLALSYHPKINSIYNTSNEFKYNLVSSQNVLIPIYGKLGLGYSLLSQLERQSVFSIQQRLNTIGEGQIQTHRVKELISKATVCLSHIGQAGLLTMNPPILGETICHASIGQVRDVAISVKGKQQKRKHVSVVLGADHRVMDGASVARFSKTWKQYSQEPTTAFINMM